MLGVVLLLLGWSDLVLIFYAVLFLLAPLLLRLPTAALLTVAVALLVPALVATAFDPLREAGTTGVLLVVGEAVPLFCVGMAVGRLDLSAPAALRRVLVAGLLLAGPGLLVLALRGGLDVLEVDGALELLAATTSTTGLCLLVVRACLRERPPGRLLAWLAVAGSMPLTAYAGHALLFPFVADQVALDLGPATALAAGYLVVVVVAAQLWRRSRGAGPLEALLRKTSGR